MIRILYDKSGKIGLSGILLSVFLRDQSADADADSEANVPDKHCETAEKFSKDLLYTRFCIPLSRRSREPPCGQYAKQQGPSIGIHWLLTVREGIEPDQKR